MGSLARRIRKLEVATGGGSDGCARCGDTTVVLMGGEVYSVSRRGQEIPHVAAVAFVREEGPQRICPECSTRRVTRFRVGGPMPSH